VYFYPCSYPSIFHAAACVLRLQIKLADMNELSFQRCRAWVDRLRGPNTADRSFDGGKWTEMNGTCRQTAGWKQVRIACMFAVRCVDAF
jgi:hypothetical protein